MSDSIQLKLHVPQEESDDTYLFERRHSTRRATTGTVTALARQHTDDGIHYRICSLNLIDMSEDGLGATTTNDIPLNSTVSVIFSPHGSEQGFDMIGRVVRTRRRLDGHEIGIHLDMRLAA